MLFEFIKNIEKILCTVHVTPLEKEEGIRRGLRVKQLWVLS